MPTKHNAQGLLFVQGECGSDVSEDEFNLWYDTDHAPARLTVPGIESALRYRATDGLEPAWLALYDLESPEVAYSDAYKSLSASASESERTLISKLALLNRRVYKKVQEITKPSTNPDNGFPGKYLLLVIVEAPENVDEEVNAWYDKEHFQHAVNPSGCYRGRRYELLDSVELSGHVDPAAPKPRHKHLTIYDWDRDTYYEDVPELEAAIATPRAKELFELGAKIIARRFVLHKEFSKPE